LASPLAVSGLDGLDRLGGLDRSIFKTDSFSWAVLNEDSGLSHQLF
jgi:hypothetical protein